MDIKWRSKICFIAWSLLVVYGLTGIILAIGHGEMFLETNYFRTSEFEGQLNEFIRYLDVLELSYQPKEELQKRIVVTEEEIHEHRYRYGDLPTQIENIKMQYEGKIKVAQQAGNQDLIYLYTKERDKKIEDITQNFQSDDYVRAKILKEKEIKLDKYYRELEKLRPELTRLKGEFVYYLKDTATGKIYTNADVSYERQGFNKIDMLFIRTYPSEFYGYLSAGENHFDLEDEGWFVQPLEENFKTFEGQIAVPKVAPATGKILSKYREYQQKQKCFYIQIISSFATLVFSYYIYKKTHMLYFKVPKNWQTVYNRIPIDVNLGIFGFSVLIVLIHLVNSASAKPLYLFVHNIYGYIQNAFFDILVGGFLLTVAVIQGKILLDRMRKNLGWEVWKESFIFKVIQSIQEAFLNQKMATQALLMLMIVFGLGAGAVIVLIKPSLIILYMLAWIGFGLPVLIFLLRWIGYFNIIANYISELAKGNLETELPIKNKIGLSVLVQNINQLKHGVKISQRERAKSERLKTELITNVSHDLRTPLTSVITYIEILKTQNLDEEDRKAYIEIIDKKAKRLKILIDDLFEASKMASGNIELSKGKVDLVQLLKQSLAEHNEKISESSLQFRITVPEKPLYAIVDGQKLWRVFDNLIGNILKYAMENTRVYISLNDIGKKAIFIFKNVTKYELGENIDELFERFKRGDISRHTEGSGLGLAIAKSIIDLHGGSMDIEVDGDLFKITIFLNILE